MLVAAAVYLQHEYTHSDHQFEITQCKADNHWRVKTVL